MEKKILTHFNISTTCRTCLCETLELNSLYDCVEYDKKIELAEILRKLSNITISPYEGKPTRICNDCLCQLIASYDFVNKIQISERYLELFLKNTNDFPEANDTITLDYDDNFLLNANANAHLTAQEPQSSIACDSDSKSSKVVYHVTSFSNRDRNDLGDQVLITNNFQRILHNDIFFDHMINGSAARKYTGRITQETTGDDTNMNGSSDLQLEKWEKENKEMKTEIYGSGFENSISSNDIEGPTEPKLSDASAFGCTICKKTFRRNISLSRHRKHHLTETSKFECSVCGRAYSRKDNLTRHEASHTNRNGKPRCNRGLCPYCGKSFSSTSLIIHIRRHTGETPYKCDMCDKGFPRSQDLLIHKRSHTGEKPHQCKTCDKSFARPNKLARHMRIHTGERPYKCPNCSKAFAQSNDLTIHIRRHTGEKPYICGVCGERFISGTNLKNHRSSKGHHDNIEQPDRYASIRVNNPNRKLTSVKSTTIVENSSVGMGEELLRDVDMVFENVIQRGNENAFVYEEVEPHLTSSIQNIEFI